MGNSYFDFMKKLESIKKLESGEKLDVYEGKVFIDAHNNIIFIDDGSNNSTFIEGCELYRRWGQLEFGLL